MIYTTKHAQKVFDVKSDQTIRNWIKEFQEFFSVDATPGKGIDLQLTEDDMVVLDLIASMRSNRRLASEIYATLKSGQRGNLPEYTPEELDLLVKGDYEKYLSTQVSELTIRNEQLTRKVEELQILIQPLRDKTVQLEAERLAREEYFESARLALKEQVDELKTQLEQERQRSERIAEQERQRNEHSVEQERIRAQEQLERLLREIAELRYKMGQIEKDGDDEEE